MVPDEVCAFVPRDRLVDLLDYDGRGNVKLQVPSPFSPVCEFLVCLFACWCICAFLHAPQRSPARDFRLILAPSVTDAGFITLQRGANVVDVRDMRAALHGLSLSPCKKRCVHSLSQAESRRPAHSVCGPGRESGCIEAGETVPSASHKSEGRLQYFQEQDNGPRPDADDVQDDEDSKNEHYDLVVPAHAVPTSSHSPPETRANTSGLIL
jgi:hypothetical protein